MPKTERQKYILKHEYDSFIENCPKKYKLFWAIVAFGGLRISEALLISANDVLYLENKILIHTLKRKGRPIIPVIFSEKIINEVKEYTISKSINNKIWPFSRQYAFKLFKSICIKAGLDSHYSPHCLRHFAGVMIAEITNGNMIEIKNRLRHSNIRSTEFYVHVSEKKQKELANKIEEYMKGV